MTHVSKHVRHFFSAIAVGLVAITCGAIQPTAVFAWDDVLQQANGSSKSGRWTSLSDQLLEFREEGKPIDGVALGDVVSLQLEGEPPLRPEGTHVIWFVSGGSVQGTIESWDATEIQLRTSELGVIRAPSTQIRSVMWAAGAKPVSPDKQAGEDALQVRTAAGSIQTLRGRVQGIDQGALAFRFQGQDRRVKLTSLVRADLHRKPQPSDATQLAITWGPLRAIPIAEIRRSKEQIQITTAWGQSLTNQFQGAAFGVLNGRVSLLSDHEPSEALHTPYFDTPFPFQRQPPREGWRLGRKRFSNGLLMHSRTELTYALKDGYESFHATVGIDRDMGQLGNAEVEIQIDGESWMRWTAKGGDEPRLIEASLRGASQLKLIVDFGEDQDVGDRVIWGNARLLRVAGESNE